MNPPLWQPGPTAVKPAGRCWHGLVGGRDAPACDLGQALTRRRAIWCGLGVGSAVGLVVRHRRTKCSPGLKLGELGSGSLGDLIRGIFCIGGTVPCWRLRIVCPWIALRSSVPGAPVPRRQEALPGAISHVREPEAHLTIWIGWVILRRNGCKALAWWSDS